jgi:hypothetical protein
MAGELWFSIQVGVGLERHAATFDGLTDAQREIRDRCGNVPKRIRRSIDAYRVARGMVPLWDDQPLKSTGDWWRDATRRRFDRERQQRRRARLRRAKHGR